MHQKMNNQKGLGGKELIRQVNMKIVRPEQKEPIGVLMTKIKQKNH